MFWWYPSVLSGEPATFFIQLGLWASSHLQLHFEICFFCFFFFSLMFFLIFHIISYLSKHRITYSKSTVTILPTKVCWTKILFLYPIITISFDISYYITKRKNWLRTNQEMYMVFCAINKINKNQAVPTVAVMLADRSVQSWWGRNALGLPSWALSLRFSYPSKDTNCSSCS